MVYTLITKLDPLVHDARIVVELILYAGSNHFKNLLDVSILVNTIDKIIAP
jgi:hypothetical protein